MSTAGSLGTIECTGSSLLPTVERLFIKSVEAERKQTRANALLARSAG